METVKDVMKQAGWGRRSLSPRAAARFHRPPPASAIRLGGGPEPRSAGLATTDGKKPAVRPMGGWAWVGKEPWCATGARSDKVRELKACPQAEYCFCDPEGRHVRLAGPVAVSTRQADKDKLYSLVPGLKEHIDDPKSAEYVVLVMKPAHIRLMATTDMQYTEVTLG